MSSMAPFGVTMNEAGMSSSSYKWQRVLLKVSGEALAGDQTQNIDPKVSFKYLILLYILHIFPLDDF